LVTGGAGFLGRSVVAELARRGCSVAVLDDGSTGDLDGVRALGADVFVGSAGDRQALECAARGASRVLHLAAIVGVARVAADPGRVLEENLRGARIVIRFCEERRLPLLFTSSSEVYGDGGADRLLSESDAPGFDLRAAGRDGRAAYALSKWVGERLALAAGERGLPVVVARPFNVAGHGQSEESGAVMARFAAAALAGDPLAVEGDGSATRCFAEVSEAAAAFVDLLDSPSARGEIVNVGSSVKITIRELAESFVRRARSRSPVVVGARNAAAVSSIRHRAPDLSRLERHIGWIPDAPIEKCIDGALRHAAERGRARRSAGS